MKVLVVEDEAMLSRQLLKDVEALGHEVVGNATSVQEAIEVIQGIQEIELAIIDIGLIGHPLGGIEVAKYLQSVFAQIAIVFLTVHGKGHIQDHALSAVTPTSYLEKPYFPHRLEVAMRISEKIRVKIPSFSPLKNTVVGIRSNIREAINCHSIKWFSIEYGQLRAYVSSSYFYEIAGYTSLNKFISDYDGVFMKISQSHAVNPWYVCKIDGNTKTEARYCYIKEEAKPILVSRRLFSKVKLNWLGLYRG